MFYEKVTEAPPDPIFGLKNAFMADKRDQKVDLCVGVFKTEDLKSPTMEAVQIAARQVIDEEALGNYLPFEGIHEFSKLVGELVLGKNLYHEHKPRIWGGQSVGGSGSLRVLGEFIRHELNDTIYVSDPTWANHRHIFERSLLQVKTYPYYSTKKKGLDFERMYDFLSKIPPKSVVVLQASCHNPTGSDPSSDEWKELSQLFRKNNLYPLFDLAYQGLGNGIHEDAESIRIFTKDAHEMALTATLSKNFSLYRQRVGAFFVFVNDEKQKSNVASQIKRNIRGLYSNPPSHGAMVVRQVLSSDSLKETWLQELTQMRGRISQMRKELCQYLTSSESGIDYSFIEKRRGMFSFCNLKKEQVQRLIEEFAVYMLYSGRVNITGLNKENVDYVAKAILAVSE